MSARTPGRTSHAQVVEHELEFSLDETRDKERVSATVSGDVPCLGLRFQRKIAEKKPPSIVGKMLPCLFRLPMIGRMLDARELPGLRVETVLPSEFASLCGVKPDWRLMSVNEHRVETVDDFNTVTSDAIRRLSEFAVGTAIEARYKGTSKYSPGKVARDCGDGSYDIDYDGGEKESGVKKTLIRLMGKKLVLRFIVFKAHPLQGAVPLTVQVPDERWHEALMYIAPKFPVFMRRFLSYAPEAPAGTRFVPSSPPAFASCS